jgi:hypothetical protein
MKHLEQLESVVDAARRAGHGTGARRDGWAARRFTADSGRDPRAFRGPRPGRFWRLVQADWRGAIQEGQTSRRAPGGRCGGESRLPAVDTGAGAMLVSRMGNPPKAPIVVGSHKAASHLFCVGCFFSVASHPTRRKHPPRTHGQNWVGENRRACRRRRQTP